MVTKKATRAIIMEPRMEARVVGPKTFDAGGLPLRLSTARDFTMKNITGAIILKYHYVYRKRKYKMNRERKKGKETLRKGWEERKGKNQSIKENRPKTVK